MVTQLERARSESARKLFIYVYNLRYKRQPFAWEVVLGQALLSGELQVTRPPETTLLRRVHLVAEDVALALQVPELLSAQEFQNEQ